MTRRRTTCSCRARRVCSRSPAAEEAPAKVGISVADISAGMYAFSSVLAALLRREPDRRGFVGRGLAVRRACRVDGVSDLLLVTAAPRRRATARDHAVIAPYGPYTAGDGKIVYLGIQNEREWARFCGQVLERPEMATDPRFSSNTRRVEHREELDAVIRPRSAGSRRRTGHRAARGGADCERADEHGAGADRSSAARGARPLARCAIRRPDRCGCSCRHSISRGWRFR